MNRAGPRKTKAGPDLPPHRLSPHYDDVLKPRDDWSLDERAVPAHAPQPNPAL
ncbi:hypothetical protein [Streptomyces sp. NPDC005953]|uniref:hypothetical protein n=1 Tax=Streptomyces sp. NPDC005953 TaxID=3156719 RepID=UPI0033D04A11